MIIRIRADYIEWDRYFFMSCIMSISQLTQTKHRYASAVRENKKGKYCANAARLNSLLTGKNFSVLGFSQHWNNSGWLGSHSSLLMRSRLRSPIEDGVRLIYMLTRDIALLMTHNYRALHRDERLAIVIMRFTCNGRMGCIYLPSLATS